MKYNIYIKASHSLYFKVLIPVILNIESKSRFYIFSNLKSFFFQFSDIFNYIKKNPTGFNLINKQSLIYISKILYVDKLFLKRLSNLKFIYLFFKIKKKSILICTTKDLDFAKKNEKKFERIIIVGYQHMPFIGLFNSSKIYEDKFDLKSNTFFNNNNFYEILKNVNLKKCKFVNLLYDCKKHVLTSKKNVLIFHPGGYRGIITNDNDSKKVSYNKQTIFFERLLLPLLKLDFDVYIKIHPLAAQYHQYSDLKIIINQNPSFNNFKNKIFILDVFDDYRIYAITSTFNLTFGSSSIYELWSIGAFNTFVCTYMNDKRSYKFKNFKDINIENIKNITDLKKIDLNTIDKELKNLMNFYNKNFEIKNLYDLSSFLDKNIN